MIRFFASAILSLAALSGCATAPVVGQAPLSGPYAMTGGTFTRVPGGVTVASELREINGMTAVCGAWAKTKKLHPWARTSPGMLIMPSGSAYLDGQRLITGLGYMNEVAPQADYTGVSANCAVSDLPWQAAYESRVPDVQLPRQAVYSEIDDDSGAGFLIVFRQTGPGA